MTTRQQILYRRVLAKSLESLSPASRERIAEAALDGWLKAEPGKEHISLADELIRALINELDPSGQEQF